MSNALYICILVRIVLLQISQNVNWIFNRVSCLEYIGKVVLEISRVAWFTTTKYIHIFPYLLTDYETRCDGNKRICSVSYIRCENTQGRYMHSNIRLHLVINNDAILKFSTRAGILCKCPMYAVLCNFSRSHQTFGKLIIIHVNIILNWWKFSLFPSLQVMKLFINRIIRTPTGFIIEKVKKKPIS